MYMDDRDDVFTVTGGGVFIVLSSLIVIGFFGEGWRMKGEGRDTRTRFYKSKTRQRFPTPTKI